VQEITAAYLMHRLSEDATIRQERIRVSNGSIVPDTNTLRYNALCRKRVGIASRACFEAKTYNLVDGWADQVDKLVEKRRLTGGVLEPEVPDEVVQMTNNLMNPP
jgi:hypothetical protein